MAFLHAVSICHLTGLELSKLVGHFTWSGLIRRPLLCVLGLVFSFMAKAGGSRRRLWSQVELELRMAAALIPVAYIDTKQPPNAVYKVDPLDSTIRLVDR